MRLERHEDEPDLSSGTCDQCGATVYRWRGQDDIDCDCGAIYNCFGQRLRDDLYSRPNPSEYDDEIGDLEGYEIAMNGD